MGDEITGAVPVSTDVELSGHEARYSHSCTDLSSYISLSTPRDSAYIACNRTHLSLTPPAPGRQTPSPPDHDHTATPTNQPSRRPSSTPSTNGHSQITSQALLTALRRPLTATRSAPRATTPSGRWRCYENSPRHSPGRLSPAVPGSVGNGRFGMRGHQGVGPQMSWSPTQQAQHTPIRPRVYSDCYSRPARRSRSFRIKQWIQARQRR